MRTLLFAAAIIMASGVALAGEPVKLTANQLDRVTAGGLINVFTPAGQVVGTTEGPMLTNGEARVVLFTPSGEGFAEISIFATPEDPALFVDHNGNNYVMVQVPSPE